ncbi:tRNA ligase [Massospora cicadina]|nr:tRNA ligase [Massospora cicadina]
MAVENCPFISRVEGELGDLKVGRPLTEGDAEVIRTLGAYADWFKASGHRRGWLTRKAFTVAGAAISAYKFSEPYFYEVVRRGAPTLAATSAASLDLPRSPASFSRVGFSRITGGVGELATTQWDTLASETDGPYDVTVKENGCIIFISHHPTHGLLVASKHSLGDLEPNVASHQRMGEVWLDRHLAKRACGREALERFVRHFNVTLVFELCDDEFEEHVLPYPEGSRGLYLHGVNHNAIHFASWPSEVVQLVAEQFGFFKVANFPQPTLAHVRRFYEACGGSLEGRAIEGFVVKYDHPYLLFREWREITRCLLNANARGLAQPVLALRNAHPLTHQYVAWVQEKLTTHPTLFSSYLQGRGIVHTRNLFFADTQLTPSDHPAPINPVVTGDRLLLVPVATIGCGKTILGTTLARLINCVPIQQDDFKRAGSFYAAILAQMEATGVVYADRNNHTSALREALTSAALSKFPSAAIVAIEFDVNSAPDAFDITYRNVLKRGAHHPTLTPGNTPELERIMGRFLKDFEPVDANLYPGDGNFTHHLRLPVGEPLAELLLTKILPGLPIGLPKQPSPTDIQAALEASLRSQRRVKFKRKKAPGPASFIGISLAGNVFGLVFERLGSKAAAMKLPQAELAEAKSIFQKLCEVGTAISFSPGAHHITLTHHTSPALTEAYLGGGPASNWLGAGVRVTFDLLVWQREAIVALSVKSISKLVGDRFEAVQFTDALELSNSELLVGIKHLHTTLGVLDAKYAPKDSNLLLDSHFGTSSPHWSPKALTLDPPIIVPGRIRSFPPCPPKPHP